MQAKIRNRIKRFWAGILSVWMVAALSGTAALTTVWAEEVIPDALKDMERLESGQLIFGFDAATGLGKTYDKRTGQIWEQYYAMPPSETVIPAVPFTDDGYWETSGAATSRNNPRSDEGVVLFELSSAFNGGRLATVVPGFKIIKGNYRVEVTYTAENAVDFGIDVSAGFRTGHYDYKDGYFNYLGTKKMETYLPTGKESGTNTLTLELRESDFAEHTAYANVTVDVLAGGSDTAGKIYIEKIALIAESSGREPVVVSNVKNDGSTIRFTVNSDFRARAGLPGFQGTVSFEQEDTLLYTITSVSQEDSFDGRLLYPGTFHNGSDSLKWVLPNNSGAYLAPFDLDSDINKKLALGEFYYNAGLSMAFIGADDGQNGGYLEIVDTPVCAGTIYPLCAIGDKAGYMPAVSFEGDKYKWGENRQVRFRFFTDGHYGNLAKEYRKIADEKGFLVTYEEKAQHNPVVRQSTGAHRVDLGIDKRSVLDFFARLKEADITNVMVKVNGVRDAEKGYAACSLQELIDEGLFEQIRTQYPEYLLYDYEFARESVLGDYPDIIRPEGYSEFADDYISVDGRGRQRLWYPYPDHTEWLARMLCPTIYKPYIDFYYNLFPAEIYPAKARMYDTLATSLLGEGQCGDPKHPCDRRQHYQIKQEAMKYLTETYGIDAHTEGNAEYLVPYVNSFEGSIDLLGLPGYGYLLISGRTMTERCPNEAEKIPLWQLVFHDCGATYWHWEYGDLDKAEMNRYCDLYTMLYGEHGMFLPKYAKTHVYSTYFDTMIERIKTLNQVTEAVAYDEMLSHEFVSNDGMVQRTTFSSGMQVTVNFSKEKTYTVEGEAIEPLGYRLHSGNTGGEPVSPPEKPVPQAAELWLYLLVGILIGGGIAAIVIALLVRKRRRADMAMVTTKTAERSSAEGEMTDEK